jgi:hypothetical protein
VPHQNHADEDSFAHEHQRGDKRDAETDRTVEVHDSDAADERRQHEQRKQDQSMHCNGLPMLQFRRSKSDVEAASPAPADLATGFAPVGSMQPCARKISVLFRHEARFAASGPDPVSASRGHAPST